MIDQINILQATHRAMNLALAQLQSRPAACAGRWFAGEINAMAADGDRLGRCLELFHRRRQHPGQGQPRPVDDANWTGNIPAMVSPIIKVTGRPNMWPRSRREALARSIGNPLRPFARRRRICLIEESSGNWLDAFVRTIQMVGRQKRLAARPAPRPVGRTGGEEASAKAGPEIS